MAFDFYLKISRLYEDHSCQRMPYQLIWGPDAVGTTSCTYRAGIRQIDLRSQSRSLGAAASCGRQN